ncbi:hypothetical protein PENSPDRAFT_751955 [Peniophora sp. CONT]|nr:hypothetical protein PENSPDRAFT_751955 [Peniophora sp. CONT]
MSGREFPSILPIPQELSNDPHSGFSMNICETLLQADRASKAALAAGNPLDSTGSIPLLDGSIDSIETTPQVLRSRSPPPRALDNETMNADAPISRLPTELIHYIFRYDADEHRIDCGEGLSIKTSWFRLARVCRVWRCVVFNMPDLWRDDIFSFREKWMDILPLTKGLPLNLRLVGTSALKFVGRHDVVPLAPRAYNIRAEIRGNQDVRTLVDVLCSEPLPHLQTVTLLGTRTRKREQPAAAKMARHPHLHFLTLNNIYLEPPPQGALYTLQLDMTGLYDEKKPSLDTILKALK